jgi:hypothetical protein
MLLGLGLVVTEDDCDATLTLELEASGLPGDYIDLGTRYTGASVSGSLTVTAPEQPTITVLVDGRYGPEGAVSTTDRRVDELDAPFGAALGPALLSALVEVWGPGAAPALTDQFRIERDRDVSTTETALRLLAEIGPPALGDAKGDAIAVPIAQLYYKSLNDDWYRHLGIDDLALATLRAVSDQDFGEDPDAWLTWAHGNSEVPSLEEQLEAALLDSLIESGFTDEEARCLLEQIGYQALFAWKVEAAGLTAASEACGLPLDRLAYLSR